MIAATHLPQPSPAPLIVLMRGTGAVLAIGFGVIAVFLVLTAFTMVIHTWFYHPTIRSTSNPEALPYLDWAPGGFAFIVGMLCAGLSYMGYILWHEVSPAAVSLFATIFSLVIAGVTFHYWPEKLIQARLHDYLAHHPGEGLALLPLGLLFSPIVVAIIVYKVARKGIERSLLQVFRFKRSRP